MKTSPQTSTDSAGGLACGVVGALGVAFALSFARGLGATVPALALMVVVIAAAALGGRVAGVYTALVAALSYNFWHTRPYQSLRIHDSADIVTTLLLAGAGLMVGALATSRGRHVAAEAEERTMLGVLYQQGDLIAQGATPDEVWTFTRDAIVDLLDLEIARFEPSDDETLALPRLARDDLGGWRHGATHAVHARLGRAGFLIPDSGAELSVDFRSEHLGRIVLLPGQHHDGASITARRTAVTLAGQFAGAVAGRSARRLD